MNIKIKKIEWSNMFSYGDNNVLDLTKNPITQLDAINGSGKTSLVYIIQEALFSKNIEGIKKGDIVNRYSGKDIWVDKIYFDIDSNEYEISVTRKGDTSKVVLLENGVNISKHKIPDTYKHLLELLGGNMDVLNQLMYQSSEIKLEFLRATDTNRKKFLVNLFHLEEYLADGELIKAEITRTEKVLTGLEGELTVVKDFLSQAKNAGNQKVKKEVPTVSETLREEIRTLEAEVTNYNTLCNAIDKNNLLIQERNSIQFDMNLLDAEQTELDEANKLYTSHSLNYNTLLKQLEEQRKQLKNLDTATHCHYCKQPIDNSHTIEMSETLNKSINAFTQQLSELQNEVLTAKKLVEKINTKRQEYAENKRKIDRFEQLSNLINTKLDSKYPNISETKQVLMDKKKLLEQQVANQTNAMRYNSEVDIFNAKRDVIIRQTREFLARQELITSDILNVQSKLDRLTILRKAFSTAGIVAFKLENIIKNFESEINDYLVELSDGQFQLNFKLEGEKLNVIVYSHGVESPIETISKGEFNRVQASTLLAIRKLLSKMSGIQINFLFLDEVFGTLDMQGKERFIEILQKEENTNTFIVAHDYSHPLVPKLSIIKENNIARII